MTSAVPSSGAAEKPKFHDGRLKPYPHEELGTADGTGRAKDPVKYYLATEQRARERQVAYETVRLLREDVIECYRREGVNHYQNCKEVNQKFYDLIQKKDMGQLHPQWKDPAKFDGW
ncbi:NADH-ubiquinone oxidoreductase subunit 10 [Nitzschia inconspicua]|uniref:NADH-ubiquinone oxidoreductase subunit 10 n=1 Tax=Nitzschia inconspicua TaxID=303405 RepID=A0A9K3KCB7_9STRA|nr:NADH-ubiquinone oxidoreductase subunit 10 [Nitzschia inconspicua]